MLQRRLHGVEGAFSSALFFLPMLCCVVCFAVCVSVVLGTIVGHAPQAIVIHRALARYPDDIPQGGDGVERTLFLRRVTEEALRVTRCGTTSVDFVGNLFFNYYYSILRRIGTNKA